MHSDRSRRSFLGALGALGVVGMAGCASRTASGRGATDVFVHNNGTVRRSVELTVTEQGSDSPDIDTSLELAPNERTKINNEVLMDSDYDVAVSYTDANRDSPYSETQTWADADSPLRILLTDQVVFARQIG
jgi:hypothetical protein